MPDEKRRSSRIFFDMPAVLSVLNTSYTVRQIANLSVGGCLLKIEDNIPVGVECEVRILIDGTPQEMRVDAEGVIVRNDDETVGVKFTRIDPEHSFHLRNIIKFSLPILKYHPESQGRF